MTSDISPSIAALPADLAAMLPPADAGAPAALAAVIAWIRPADPDDAVGAEGRIRELTALVRSNAGLRVRLQAEVHCLLPTARGVPLLAEAGILSTHGFFGEIVERLYERVLPAPPRPDDLRGAFGKVFDDAGDARWVPAVADACWLALVETLESDAPGGPGLRVLLQRSAGAIEVLALRIAAEGTQTELLHIDPEANRHDSPFLALQREVADYLRMIERQGVDLPGPPDHAHVLLAQCLDAVARLRAVGRRRGTSVRVTYLLERMEQHLRRLELLLRFLAPPAGTPRAAPGLELFRVLAQATALRLSISQVWQSNTRMLAKRITENASQTGEHYAARDREEYFAMMRAAMGAGVLIALMALLKIQVKELHLPPLIDAALVCADYALGFVVIHVLHFTVATKQPAMTAAMIAASIEEAQARRRSPLDNLAQTIASVARTQVVAIFGNIALALPLAMAIASAYGASRGAPLLHAEKSGHLLQELRPVAGFALLHAAIAGVWLFVAGLVSGWYDNRCAVLDIPERVRGSPLFRWLPRSWVDRLADYVDGNLGALMGNVVFGVLLGATGFFGVLVGLPIDIRHVAFASANLGYAAVSSELAPAPFALGFVFVLLIASVNLLVSFSLALHVALRARGVTFGRAGELASAVFALARASPRAFFLPPPRMRAPG